LWFENQRKLQKWMKIEYRAPGCDCKIKFGSVNVRETVLPGSFCTFKTAQGKMPQCLETAQGKMPERFRDCVGN
jgi:hypothetical protein